MMRSASTGWLTTLALALAVGVSGCSDDDPIGGAPPPNLSGTYTLSSITQAGVTLSPPAASGTITVTQTSSNESSASGDYSITLMLPDGQGGTTTIIDNGTYTNRSDGTWEQDSSTLNIQSVGTVALVGSTLTVDVTAPAAINTVWQRQ